MAKLIAGFLLSGFIILAVVHLGEAACSWVLWRNLGTTDPNQELSNFTVQGSFSSWQPIRTFDTAEACNTAMYEADRREMNILGPKRNENKPKGALWDFFVYRCLPDTIDPREPKTGGR